jgi:hypothetical protein
MNKVSKAAEIAESATAFTEGLKAQTADQLIEKFLKIKDHCTAQQKQFSDYLKPFQEQMVEIENKLLAMLHELNKNKPDAKKAMLSCDAGTAYLSTIVSPKVAERDAYIDFILDNWDAVGNAMLQVGAPQKDAVQEYLDSHEGQLPPGVTTSAFTRVNIRRS